MTRHNQSDENKEIKRMVDEGLGAGRVKSDVAQEEQARQERKYLAEMAKEKDVDGQGRERFDLDVDRMVNEGLGGGNICEGSGLIEESHVPELRASEEGE
ncbi:hypothetical protein [Marininema halotolerans]|uniref:Uncharacterized protein n=1 Tax=Marininema halotolerans TaxID=1155944 RepID=A0A1I6PSQ0_9BACL|nr:hypothetical protein [Marininema halotolerans]SFS43088.1 hypothetical protein SAMN05444972_102101 [Marininema halotolerans]